MGKMWPFLLTRSLGLQIQNYLQYDLWELNHQSYKRKTATISWFKAKLRYLLAVNKLFENVIVYISKNAQLLQIL